MTKQRLHALTPQLAFMIVQNAASKNGWRVLGMVMEGQDESEVPHGAIVFRRQSLPTRRPEIDYGTAGWAMPEGDPYFQDGHYDLTREGAWEDFADRIRGLP